MFNSVFIASTEFTPAEVSTVLDHVVPRASLLTAAALRLCGHDVISSACASFTTMVASPEALGAVLAFFEKDQPEQFASLVDEAREHLGDAAIRTEWRRLRAAHGIEAHDSAMSFRVADFAAKPVAGHKKDRAAQRFAFLIESKQPRGNAPMYEAHSVIHY
jgi:hypothetical protein